MSIDEVRQIILNILEDIAPDEDISSIDDNTRLRDQIDLDSMDVLDIVILVNNLFESKPSFPKQIPMVQNYESIREKQPERVSQDKD